ncbi:MAG: ribokinase, partial [Frankiales bacterium]|nr:ribokinase [Frankiales bacterium]
DGAALRTSASPTGTAWVTVDAEGENAIVVDLGANATLLDLTPQELALVQGARVLLCQLEAPVATVVAAAAAARGLRVLNAAPARALPSALTEVLDVLVVNEQEALDVAGADALEPAVELLLQRVPEVVVTLGAAGALVASRTGGSTRVPGVPARQVVDTTGAGDVFCGSFAAARAVGELPVPAARLACAAASLSVERAGAGTSAPTLEQARARLPAVG